MSRTGLDSLGLIMRVLVTIAVLFVVSYAWSQEPAPPQPQPNYVLSGKLTESDNHTYRSLPFEVKAGTRRVTIVFSHTAADQRTVIDLGLYDPQRLRGWSGSDKKWFTVSDMDATASYLPGAIQPGTWKLLLGVPNIRKGVTAEYTAKIYLGDSIELPNIARTQVVPIRAGPAWYQGDLHGHTGHSDGKCDSMHDGRVFCPEFKILEKAASLGLDFVAVTDHNTVSHHNALEQWQPYFDRLLLIRGREITTFFGHSNVWGTSGDIDFRVGPGLTATDMVESARAVGGTVSLNHPGRPSNEDCMGCGWTASIDFSQVDAIEAVNGIDADTPVSGIPFWEARLNEGHRITAVGGSDDHSLPEVAGLRGALGTPTTVVYASEFSERAVLNGIRAGHVFLKVQGPSGPSIYLEAKADQQSAMVGDNLKTSRGKQIAFSVKVVGASGSSVEIIRDGKQASVLTDSRVGSGEQSLRFSVVSDGEHHWYRANLRGADGRLLALTNPIYENFPDSHP